MKKALIHALLVVLLIVASGTLASATVTGLFIRYRSVPTDSITYTVAQLPLITVNPHQVAGQTFWVGSNQDSANYGATVAAITDGSDDLFMLLANYNGVGYLASQFPGIAETGHQDFIGNRINRLGLTVYGYNSLYDSLDFDMLVDYTPVPEPSSLVALSFGAVGLCEAVCRRRRR